ncbi:hypothetical protein cypCar_00036953 [Cyprinus carpio]|nr:hypothetical protein cypCar_00036953 [Cyprinus carpio]
MDDPYQNNVNQQGETYPTYGGGEYTYPYQTDYPPQEEEDAASDVTEGHDDDEQMYEGEYPPRRASLIRTASYQDRGPGGAESCASEPGIGKGQDGS